MGPLRRRISPAPQARRLFAAAPTAVALAALVALAPEAAHGQGSGLVGADGGIDWNRYYSAAESDQIMRELHARYPELTELHVVGESYEGRPLLLMEVTNEATGPAVDKPALYVDGGLHAAELTGSAVALHLLGHVLQGYGRDGQVTELLDTRAFYIRPKFNPDGSDLALLHDQFLRSSVHPVDEDHDGLADEDPPSDLDGDGWITTMRVPDPAGDWYADPGDPRILRRVPGGGGVPAGAQRYRTHREGLDEDGDGRFNEDGIGGLDLNRNFPRNWERVHLQPGAGDFPLSEPETYAAVRFIESHPNITGIVHGHTSGGFVYRLPSASAPSTFPADDLELIEHLGAEYTRTTGRPVRPSATHPTEHRYGTLITWGYWDEGVVGWVPEYSPGPEAWVTDYDGDGEIGAVEEMRFNDEELGGRYFSPWTSYRHPQLGEVEIGGWHTKFWGQNPPAEFLREETEAQLPWILYLASRSPRIVVEGARATSLGEGRYRIDATVRNAGFLPTSVTGRGTVGRSPSGSEAGRLDAESVPGIPAVVEQVVRPVHATLEGDGVDVVDGPARLRVGHLGGTGPYLGEVGPSSREVSWIVRVRSADPPVVRVMARSDKGGTARSAELRLGGGPR